MAERVRKQRPKSDVAKTETEPDKQKAEHKSGEELKADLDAILDDIEEVLEENAAVFIADFVQKGGE